jgi:hypothetical protein
MEPPHAPPPDPPDRRTPRHRVLRTGIITYQECAISFRCTIRDRSQRGARLRVPGGLVPPNDFWLIEVSEAIAHRAHAAWRRGDEIGVELGEQIGLREVGRLLLHRQLHALWLAAAGS